MAWVYLVIAGLFEVVWAVGLKHTEGFTKLWPSLITLGAMLISFWLLALAMKVLPMGTSYAIWVGIGAVGAVIFGMIMFKEPATLARLISIAFIIIGIIGLKISSS